MGKLSDARPTSQPPRSDEARAAVPHSDVIQCFQVKDPIMPSTAAMLFLSYKRSEDPDRDKREVDMFICDAVSAQDSVGTAGQTPKSCVLDENLFSPDEREFASLCSLRKLDPSKQGL